MSISGSFFFWGGAAPRNPFFGCSGGEEGKLLLRLHGLGVGSGVLHLALKLTLGPKVGGFRELPELALGVTESLNIKNQWW